MCVGSKAAFESKDARWVGAGGNGMKQGLLKIKKVVLQNKKPPGGQGGFV
jgi:hypothetical protein